MPENEKSSLSHIPYAIFMFIIGILAIFISIGYSDMSWAVYATMIAKKTTTILLFVLFEYYWRSSKHDVSKEIWNEPIAVAIYIGSAFIAISLS